MRPVAFKSQIYWIDSRTMTRKRKHEYKTPLNKAVKLRNKQRSNGKLNAQHPRKAINTSFNTSGTYNCCYSGTKCICI